MVLIVSCAKSGMNDYELFGEKFNTEGSISINEFNDLLVDKDKISVKLKGEIKEVCQSKGCWMKLKTGDELDIRVTFKDYGFFVPKNSSGRNSIVSGTLSEIILTDEEARHFAEDEGKEYDPEKTYEEYAFIASGVLIEKTGD